MKSLFKFATRLDNLVLVICLCLYVGVIAYGENGPTPKVIVGSSGIVDGSVTPAKISSGHNLLTDAEKTQALVGSSTVDFVGQNITSKTRLIASGTIQVVEKTVFFSNNSSLPLVSLIDGVPAGNEHGRLTIVTNSATIGCAEFFCAGKDVATVELQDALSKFSATANNSGTFNVFAYDASYVLMQNLSGADLTIFIKWEGLD